jgi:hypothetical protein
MYTVLLFLGHFDGKEEKMPRQEKIKFK